MTDKPIYSHFIRPKPGLQRDNPIDTSDNPHSEEAATSPTSTPTPYTPPTDEQVERLIEAINLNTEAMDRLTMKLFDDADRASERETNLD